MHSLVFLAALVSIVLASAPARAGGLEHTSASTGPRLSWVLKNVPVWNSEVNFAVRGEHLLTTGENTINAYNLSTGEQLWVFQKCWESYDCQGQFSAPTFTGDGGVVVVMVGGNPGDSMVCLEASTGKLRWRTPIAGGMYNPSWSIVDPVAIAPMDDVAVTNFESGQNLTALDTATGKVLWWNQYFGGSPLYLGGFFWVVKDNRMLCRVDVLSGKHENITSGYTNLMKGGLTNVGDDTLAFYCSHTPSDPTASLTRLCAITVLPGGQVKDKWISQFAFMQQEEQLPDLSGNADLVCSTLFWYANTTATCLNGTNGNVVLQKEVRSTSLALPPSGSWLIGANESTTAIMLEKYSTSEKHPSSCFSEWAFNASAQCKGLVGAPLQQGPPLVHPNGAVIMISDDNDVNNEIGCIVAIVF